MTRALSDSMVKAFLFLLVAVAVADDATCAASSPSCPSKMQADANTLLQTGVRIGDEKITYTDEVTNPHKVSWMQEGMNTQQLKEKLIDNSKGKGRHEELIQLSRFINTLGNATEHFDSSNAETLNKVMKILRTSMYKSMNADHTEDQNELNQAFAAMTTCNTDLGTATNDTVAPSKSTMVTARITHKTCRTEEARLETIKSEKWNDVETHIAVIPEPPPVKPFPEFRTYEAFVEFFESGFVKWLGQEVQGIGGAGLFDAKKDAYESAKTNWITRTDRCDSDQTMFERNFCAYNSALDTTCSTHDTCFTGANSSAITTKAWVQRTEAGRKDAYKAGEQIVCRINALLGNHDYSQCDNLTVNTSHYNIVYPTPDAKVSCITEPQAPCSTTWVDEEYNGLPEKARSTACTPCHVSPSPPVSTGPPVSGGVSE